MKPADTRMPVTPEGSRAQPSCAPCGRAYTWTQLVPTVRCCCALGAQVRASAIMTMSAADTDRQFITLVPWKKICQKKVRREQTLDQGS
jgi:hypothetical protein